MVEVLPKHIKDAWERWNIKGLLILSLSLQTFLIFFAPLRKRKWSKLLTLVLWSSYLLADWSPSFAAGLISKNLWKDPKPNESRQEKKLMAMWSPFLILHLGGPDTITALSLEDNVLWTRHLLGLVFQLLAAVFAVLQSLPNHLWLPTLFLFIAGVLKYLERTIALNLASSGKFSHAVIKARNLSKDDIEEAFEESLPTTLPGILMWLFRKSKNPLKMVKPERYLTDLEIVQYAYEFFNHFNSLVSNLVFSFGDLEVSKKFFEKTTPEEALMVIEAELCFIYHALYSKAAVLHSKIGILFRVIASGSLLWAFQKFHYSHQKSREFQGAAIVVTYTLFLVGIALDLASTFMLLLSDWTFVVLSKLKGKPEVNPSRKDAILNWILGFKRPQWKKQISSKGDSREIHDEALTIPFLLGRWAGKIYTFNFTHFCLKADEKRVHKVEDRTGCYVKRLTSIIWTRVRRCISDVTNRCSMKIFSDIDELLRSLYRYIIDVLNIEDLLHEMRLQRAMSSEPLTKTLWSDVFELLKRKSRLAETLEDAKKISSSRGEWALRGIRSETLTHYVENVDFDKSLLLWHIATEILYQEEEPTEENIAEREFSRKISGYMMYLMIFKPELMSEVAGLGTITFKEALAEADEFIRENPTEVKLTSDKIASMGDEGVLVEASLIAKELKIHTNGENKWRVLSQVWSEFLSFAALHSDAKARLEQLSRGGELVDFVWLLMAHFGLVY
ncbi:PREDICTED: uncharacterized protein LOC104814000 [Tarenaya hassleriana]|uniref:uncharacterized protein LOC104814000 n=1 Tax=Tarenaya hassleriana TaxID=28532 RepID=UPI00053C866C|nr:PREDICTED: uncharacterized protein LOC104814000 [Tarenaya hassleriana]